MIAGEPGIDPREVDQRATEQDGGKDDNGRQGELSRDERTHSPCRRLADGVPLGRTDRRGAPGPGRANGRRQTEQHRGHNERPAAKTVTRASAANAGGS